jgi:RimJ/RimL family protein N-acetyltransferase
MADIGRERYRDLIAGCTGGSLDRVDRDAVAAMSAPAWSAAVIDDLCQHENTWYVIYAPDGEPAGFIAIEDWDEPGCGTIGHVGVATAYRGRGYIHQLLRLFDATARAKGWKLALSDTDVDNIPMRQAFLKAGHRDDARPWHKWYHRRINPS